MYFVVKYSEVFDFINESIYISLTITWTYLGPNKTY